MWLIVIHPAPELRGIVAATLSRLRLPHGRIPAWVLANLKSLGFSAQFTDIRTMNKAAMARAFLRSAQLVNRLNGDRD